MHDDNGMEFSGSKELSLKEILENLSEFVKYVICKWKIILSVSLAGALIGILISIYIPPKYNAEVTFAIDDVQSPGGLASYAGLASSFGFNIGKNDQGVFSSENIPFLIKSRFIITKTLMSSVEFKGNKITLADYYIKLYHLFKSNGGLHDVDLGKKCLFPASSSEKFTRFQDSMIQVICNRIVNSNLVVKSINDNNTLFSVSCNSIDPNFSLFFSRSIVSNVSKFYVQTKTNKIKNSISVLQTKLDSLQNLYSNELVSSARIQDMNLSAVKAILEVPKIKKQTIAQIIGAQIAEVSNNLELEKLQLLEQTPFIQIIDEPILPLSSNHFGIILSSLIGFFLMILISILIIFLAFIFKNTIN